MNVFEFYKLKHDPVACEFCLKRYAQTVDIEGIGPFTAHVVCDGCNEAGKALTKINAVIGDTNALIKNLPPGPSFEKAKELLKNQRIKRDVLVRQTREFLNRQNGETKRNDNTTRHGTPART